MQKGISNWGDFLFESKITKLLLEGNLTASDRFLNKLSKIKSNSIANLLYNTFSDKKFIDKNLSQNYIDVAEKDDTVSFIGDRNVDKAKEDNPIVDPFTIKGRNEIKVGRLARAILTEIGEKVNDKDIESFVNTYKASKESLDKKFKIVNGIDIKRSYDEKNYAFEEGSLGNSCMSSEDCQRYFKLYTKNPDQCQLLVYLDKDDKILGRALVWKIFKKELNIDCSSEYFMDRIYTCKESDEIKFQNYAKESGWLYKWKNSSDRHQGVILQYNNLIVFGRIYIKLDRVHFGKYPYMDTLKFCDNVSLISNVGFAVDLDDEDYDEQFIMEDTGGRKEECDDCDNTGYIDNGDDCSNCNGNGETNCIMCRGGGSELCTNCDGDGNIKCLTCDGNGETDCQRCNGSGDVTCQSCRDGYNTCIKCNGDGNSGKCKKCNKDGEILCTECNEKEKNCNNCKGVGRINRKWGTGTRNVACEECGGVGRASTGSIRQTGCMCGTCGIRIYNGQWINSGYTKCKDCDDGMIPCDNCHDKEGYGDPGQIECEKCDGNGEFRCNECSHGSINCKDCDGNGNTGECEKCDGDGTIGDCKNPKCDSGETKCEICNGSGKRPKNGKRELCTECSGVLESTKKDIDEGRIKLR